MTLAFAAIATLLAALTLGSGSAFAQSPATNYPNKAIRFVVPYTPGGTTDILARIIAAELTKNWGQQVFVDNRPGAGGNIGTGFVAKADPDGYTIVMGAISTHAINPSLYKNIPYDHIKDFAPVTRVGLLPNVLVVNPSLPVKTVKEFIAYGKANPGKLSYASPGTGTSLHLSGELFKSVTGVDMVHVSYKGSAPALTDLLGGQVLAMFDNLPASLPHIKAGKLRALAVTTAKRAPALPEVPTMVEAGVPDFVVTSWFAVFVPAKTPKEIIAKLNSEMVKVLNSPGVKE
ncbi:MAG TPA: tripartite tricarboxylate transporter substrate binding protein, partial [Burkholderiales bacterium]|nr:tripartite tricarboxylate transporter substrate binding protein [Burkholderiales bacterium]